VGDCREAPEIDFDVRGNDLWDRLDACEGLGDVSEASARIQVSGPPTGRSVVDSLGAHAPSCWELTRTPREQSRTLAVDSASVGPGSLGAYVALPVWCGGV